jgi:hypothetical protein
MEKAFTCPSVRVFPSFLNAYHDNTMLNKFSLNMSGKKREKKKKKTLAPTAPYNYLVN